MRRRFQPVLDSLCSRILLSDIPMPLPTIVYPGECPKLPPGGTMPPIAGPVPYVPSPDPTVFVAAPPITNLLVA